MSGKAVLDSNIAATSIVSNATRGCIADITRDKELLNVSFPGLHTMPVYPPPNPSR